MFLITAHGTVLVAGRDDGRLLHLPPHQAAEHHPVTLDAAQLDDGAELAGGPLRGFTVRRPAGAAHLHLLRDGLHLCAEDGRAELVCDRAAPGAWESFHPVARIEREEAAALLRHGLWQYQLGNLADSIETFGKYLILAPGDATAEWHLRTARAALAPPASGGAPCLVRQVPRGMWEDEWTAQLLDGLVAHEIDDGTHSVFRDPMVVIDQTIDAARGAYYRAAHERGCRVILLHLSDEFYFDDCAAYQWCHAVWRNYWSPVLARLPHVRFMPLGFKSGFFRPGIAPRAAERAHVWSFAGDVKKTSRAAMHEAMSRVPGGHCHLTSAFGSADALSTAAYRGLMEQSIYAPCPAGNINLDTFRVSEALEAGCIPIVERRPGFDYFTQLFGPHPIPTVSDWNEAPSLIAALDPAATEALRAECAAWWRGHVAQVRAGIAASIRDPARGLVGGARQR